MARHSLARPLGLVLFTLAVTFPMLFVLGVILYHGVNVPLLDEWGTTAIFVTKFFSGTLTLNDLAAPYNGHRLLIPQLVMVGLAALTRWDVRYEMLANWLVLLLTWLVTAHLLFVSQRPNERVFFKPLAIALVLLIFNIMPGYSLIYGFHLAWNLENFFIILVIWALTKWRGTWKGIFIGAFAALCATYSLASGPAIWLIGSVGFFVGGKAWQGKQIAFWIGSGLATLTFFFIGYNTGSFEGNHINPLDALEQPLVLFQFALTALGGIWGNYTGGIVALLFGGAGLLMAIGSILYLWRAAPARFSQLTPWIQIMLFGLAAAVLIASGRIKVGLGQALANEYVTGTILFWIGMLPVFAVAMRTMLSPSRLGASAVSTIIALVFGWGYINSSVSAFESISWANLSFRIGQAALYEYSSATGSELATVFTGDLRLVRRQAARLEALRLGPFASGTGAEITARWNEEWLQSVSMLNLTRSALPPDSIYVAPPTGRISQSEYGDVLDVVVNDQGGAHIFVDATAFPNSDKVTPASSRVLEIRSRRASYMSVNWGTTAGQVSASLTGMTFADGWKTFRVPVPPNTKGYAINTNYLDSSPLSDSLRIATYDQLDLPARTDADLTATLTSPTLWYPVNIQPASLEGSQVLEWQVEDDPILIFTEPLNVCVSDYSHLFIRMGASVSEAEKRFVQIFFRTNIEIDWGAHVITLPLQPDDEIHDYIYDLKSLALEANTRLTGLRIDPIIGKSPNSDNRVRLVELRLIKRADIVGSQCT